MIQGGKQKTLGFTIIEVLIVLAVSGALLISAIIMINGHQNKTEFKVAINDLTQQFQQIINETASGYYPGGKLTCTAGAAGALPTITASGAGQGTSASCIFLGKALRIGGNSIDPTYQTFTIYPLVANRLSGGEEVLDPTKSSFVTIAPGVHINSSAPDRSIDYQTKFGLTYQWSKYWDPGGGSWQNAQANTSIVAFAAKSSAGYSSLNGTSQLSPGAQNLSLYSFTNSVGTAKDKQLIDKFGTEGLAELDHMQLCFASGTTNMSGLITIGNNGGLGVTLKIYNGKTCAKAL